MGKWSVLTCYVQKYSLTLNQRVLGSSPSASTTFSHFYNILSALLAGRISARGSLGSSLGSSGTATVYQGNAMKIWAHHVLELSGATRT